MAKKNYKRGQKVGTWTLKKYLGGGGNGEVWQCTNSKGEHGAIKLLKAVRPKSYARFRDEIIVIEKNSDVKGIIPILDKNLPEDLGTETPYYVMPIAQSAEQLLNGKSIEYKVDAILQVCETLKELHNRKIAHRDIKPPNLLFYNSNYSLADFGLVDYPEKQDISLKNEEIGAKWTLAPEMRRESSNADGLKADVYSLAKTLWIVLTEKKKGFDGQYSSGSILDLGGFFPQVYTAPLDKLLSSSTDNDPKVRPTIDDFIFTLKKWKSLNENFHERNLQQWFEVQQKLFPAGFPKRVIWEDLDDIINVLRIVCSYDNLNHMFFPDGGGLDLLDVRLSAEEGCLELDFELIDIVKPKRLIFESFGYDPEWNYFRLELDELSPWANNDTVEESEAKQSQSLTQVYPGVYEDYDFLDTSYHHAADDPDYERPEGMIHVSRWLRGTFVIFNKRSTYNLNSQTYDGRHNKMDTEEFRNYIQRNVNIFRRKEMSII